MGAFEVFPVRFPKSQLDQLKQLAAREGIATAVLVRELITQGLSKKATAAAQGPLVEALHSVLPSYFEPLAEAVVSARFDAVVARELAQAATMASLLNQEGMSLEKARELVTNTLGQAIKVAKRRVREQPDLALDPKRGDAG